MIDTQNKNCVTIVGYEQATITQEFVWWIGEECTDTTVVEPANLVPSDNTAYIVSITRDLEERKSVIKQLKNKVFAKFVHSSSIIHGTSKVGYGTFVAPNVSLFFDCAVGSHCIIGPYSMIGHRTVIGTNNIIHPGTLIAGACSIGNDCLFGMRSTVIDKISICNDVRTGANTLVTKDITTPGRYIGSPARKR